MPPKHQAHLTSFILILALLLVFIGCERPLPDELSRTAYLLTDPTIVNNQEHADNHLTTTYNLAKDLPGLGRFTITYPQSMVVGLSDFVILQLTPTETYGTAPLQINAAKASFIPGSSPTTELQTIEIQPKITALLNGENYTIQAAEASSFKLAAPEKPLMWVWVITPENSNTPELNLRLFNTIKSNQKINDDLLASIPLEINVTPNETGAAPVNNVSLSLILIIAAAFGLFLLFIYAIATHQADAQRENTNQPPPPTENIHLPTDLATPSLSPTPNKTGTNQNISPQYLSHLRLLLVENFNAEDLKTLAFDLGYQYDQIRGESLEGKARELILRVKHEGRLDELIILGQKARPRLDWQSADYKSL